MQKSKLFYVELTAMTAKASTTIYLNAELINIAKESALNISKTCENALKLAISRLQGTNSETKDALSQFGTKFNVVDRAGFNPRLPRCEQRHFRNSVLG
jgi:post-segregation antitoxin (ccd killing protein)